ncbi:c-type cytochrome [Flavobacterium sp. CYK-4]|uniref:di-heme oxidoreductase family protein n=1 Tax=Flavobacterium lotistagni TaxID=2709660 RepID=UPI001408A14A|nr:di-heme oxidoredictase family protein [Flavobacterium lotistagni]NHM06339.1 c-type cytochrome [Flavobacterium lotistagni]
MNSPLKYFACLVLTALFFSCSDNESESAYEDLPSLNDRLMAGGETTVFLTSSNSFSTPAPNLSASDLSDHLAGDVDFEAIFVTAPASINQGLGTIFNNSSCVSCHPRDGRAAFPTNLNAKSGFFFRVSLPGQLENGGSIPVPGFGTQIQNQAIFGYQPEGKFQVTFQDVVEVFADGTQVILKKPNYSLIDTYIPFPGNALISPRIGSPVFGLGLLEAITEEDILQNQDIYDVNADGISGKANYVFDAVSGTIQLGRFGWKANTATILEQCAGAYNGDMGITSYLKPIETGFGQTNGEDGLGDDPELPDAILHQVAAYCKTLAVPAPRNLTHQTVRRGAKIFEEIQCAKCHIPKMKTGHASISALANQTIFPYSDLLLHDMGEGLADHRPDFLADGNEWKTRPLWGIGLTQVVNGHTHFLHDGRAKNITEAILWHGGEALSAKNKFKQLPAQDRAALLEFINSL